MGDKIQLLNELREGDDDLKKNINALKEYNDPDSNRNGWLLPELAKAAVRKTEKERKQAQREKAQREKRRLTAIPLHTDVNTTCEQIESASGLTVAAVCLFGAFLCVGCL